LIAFRVVLSTGTKLVKIKRNKNNRDKI